jgi:hypothetical protein
MAAARRSGRPSGTPCGWCQRARVATGHRCSGCLGPATETVELANAREAAAAAAATLRPVTEIKLAVDRLSEHPHLAAEPDFGTGPDMGTPELALELHAALGLANRAPSAYAAMLPEVGAPRRPPAGRRLSGRSPSGWSAPRSSRRRR